MKNLCSLVELSNQLNFGIIRSECSTDSKINSLAVKGPFNFCIRLYCALCSGWELLKPISIWMFMMCLPGCGCGTVPKDQLNVLVKRERDKRERKVEEWVVLAADTGVMCRFLGPILLITTWSSQDDLQAVLQDSCLLSLRNCLESSCGK